MAGDIALVGIWLILATPAIVLVVECLASVLLDPLPTTHSTTIPASDSRVAVLVPAHNEEALISNIVTELRHELKEGDRILVVADNCTDRTASLAGIAGAEVVERFDAAHRGKGYAITFGTEFLAKAPPDAVVVIDADCRIAPGSIQSLAGQALATRRPAQATYLFETPEGLDTGSLTAISEMAAFVRNVVRPQGLARLGLPCHLMGSGMAFPWPTLRDAKPTGSSLVEDLLMSVDLASEGHGPLLCTAATVFSRLPDDRRAALTQRRRWEHGALETHRRAPEMIRRGLRRRQIDLIAAGLDLSVPPLSLLTSLLAIYTFIAFAFSWASVASPIPATLGFLSLMSVAGVTVASCMIHCRSIAPLTAAFRVPIYLLWKLPVYFDFFTQRREHEWKRTQRIKLKSP